ncbi:hypothetical protein [Alkalinema sp. FACHB-956]|nr:hypothetical protein [Alkalinema sp. FACHB-956]
MTTPMTTEGTIEFAIAPSGFPWWPCRLSPSNAAAGIDLGRFNQG